MKLAWATDIHLNFVTEPQAVRFCEGLADSGAEALLLGGDVGEADSLDSYLTLLATTFTRPIYYVLGNHDYYGSSVREVREQCRRPASPLLHWLPATGLVPLGADTALIGHGGWGDARAGDFDRSTVVLSDYLLIDDLREATPGAASGPTSILDNKPALAGVMRALGDEAAAVVAPPLAEAVTSYPRVLFLTHVPPFAEACWHHGRTSDQHWLPMFTCEAVGHVLRSVAADNPSCQITVLCGHTHGTGRAQILPNLVAFTRGTEYGRPSFLLLDDSARDFTLSAHDWTDTLE